MKQLLIRQPAGLGDIFMSLKIAIVFQKKGFEIVWPVLDHYLYINEYLNIPFRFIPLSSNFKGKELFNLGVRQVIDTADILYLPIQDASHIVGDPIMSAKYRLAGVEMNDYLDYFEFNRIQHREDHLFYNYLDLIKGVSSYRLRNKNYASLPDVIKFERQFVDTNRQLNNVDMIISRDSHIFDWCSTIENSKEFHTVSTAIVFISEKLDTTNTELFMYRRKENSINQFEDDKKLFKKPWRFIY